MNRRGFTLVELLAMLVVIGIIIGVAIPNIVGIMASQKLNVIKVDANKMVETAKMKMSIDKTLKKPANGECIAFSLNNLNDNQDIDKGPNGGTYRNFDSLVVIKREGSRYDYYVRLIEEVKANDYFGIEFKKIDNLQDSDITKITLNEADQIGTSATDTNNINKLTVSIGCTISAYYPGHIFTPPAGG